MLGIVPSIEMVIWVALGGRATLVGAVAGALVVNYAKSGLSEQFPGAWTYFQGLLFILVIAFIPSGVAGGIRAWRKRMAEAAAERQERARAASGYGETRVRMITPRCRPEGPAMSALLQLQDIEVDFDGFKALNGLTFAINQGEVRFLIGPNGAGKTTAVDVITSLTKPTAGHVSFQGEVITGKSEFDIVKMGIGRTFQNPSVFDDLTVVENIDLAASFRMGLRKMLRKRRGISDEVAEALELINMTDIAERPAGELSHGQRQWLEIGMLLAQDPKLLLLDEPVAGMSKPERQSTGELLHEIAKTRTVMVVEHDMEFLRQFASVVTVMHEGAVLCEGDVATVQADPTVQEVYLGRSRVAAEDEATAAVEG